MSHTTASTSIVRVKRSKPEGPVTLQIYEGNTNVEVALIMGTDFAYTLIDAIELSLVSAHFHVELIQ